MYCKICNKPVAPQFDYCFEHRRKKEKEYIRHSLSFEVKHNNMDEELAHELLNDLDGARDYLSRAK